MRATRPWGTSPSRVTCLVVALALAGCADEATETPRSHSRRVTSVGASGAPFNPGEFKADQIREVSDEPEPPWYEKALIVTLVVVGAVAGPLNRASRRRAAIRRQRVVDEAIRIESNHDPVVGVAHAINRGYATVDDLIAACCQATYAATWRSRDMLEALALGVRRALPDGHGIKDVNSSRRLLLDGDDHRVSTPELRERLRDALSVFNNPDGWRALRMEFSRLAEARMERLE